VDETPLSADALRPGLVVLDTVYQPAETRLAREAAARGARGVSGVQMLLSQAAAQFELWHGGNAPLDAMRAAL
jgi:shikimate 5-dehydrogenase